MKFTFLSALAILLLIASVISPEVLVSLNNTFLGKLFLLCIVLTFTYHNLIFGIIIALTIYHISASNVEKMTKMNSKKVQGHAINEIAGSNPPSSCGLVELKEQMKETPSKNVKVEMISSNVDTEGFTNFIDPLNSENFSSLH